MSVCFQRMFTYGREVMASLGTSIAMLKDCVPEDVREIWVQKLQG